MSRGWMVLEVRKHMLLLLLHHEQLLLPLVLHVHVLHLLHVVPVLRRLLHWLHGVIVPFHPVPPQSRLARKPCRLQEHFVVRRQP